MGDFPLMTNAAPSSSTAPSALSSRRSSAAPACTTATRWTRPTSTTYTATVIPYRGAWLEYETDPMDVFYVRIDKNRKIPITCLIRALGVETDGQIKELFGEDERILATLEKDTCKTREESLLEIYRRLRPGEPPTWRAPRAIWTPSSRRPPVRRLQGRPV